MLMLPQYTSHQEAIMSADYTDTIRTLIFSGRPLRVRKTAYVADWENNRAQEIQASVVT